MSWQYLNAPSDGQVMLMWIAPRMSNNFPTDGYIWAGQEDHSLHDVGGYVGGYQRAVSDSTH